MATGDFTTLDNAREWLQITGTTDDDLLERMITAISGYMKTWLNRAITSRSYTEQRDGTGTARMVMAEQPVTAVTQLTIDGVTIPPALAWGQVGYVFDERGITLVGYRFSPGRNNVVVAYTAGYAVVPAEIEQACIEWLALRYRERDRIGHSSKSIQGESVSFITTAMPDSVKTLLKKYTKVVPL